MTKLELWLECVRIAKGLSEDQSMDIVISGAQMLYNATTGTPFTICDTIPVDNIS